MAPVSRVITLFGALGDVCEEGNIGQGLSLSPKEITGETTRHRESPDPNVAWSPQVSMLDHGPEPGAWGLDVC